MRIRIRNLPRSATIGDLERLLAPWNPRDIFRIADRSGTAALCYATVSDELAAECVTALDHVEFLGRRLSARIVGTPRWELRHQF